MAIATTIRGILEKTTITSRRATTSKASSISTFKLKE